ncbi:MAG: M3 family metallopeptidase [Campylobacteraceae bacterium]|jgi:oligopeptidase A|nr:M3 family metallopeptidase [Campylobacteraceae bacterium]MBT3882007.1 M3 family metallopeptidase [Campylobacteraceae bacterium]MBT4029991.1 M3 family metallopeptidase [Campylobacteraceae bacterium]MBT4179951.1 M3 family metallopeptidase [Campylobacteraceae bacterium]MBT4572255.1 M3 family metallopeptidase [Campylobacteraceae bacterium]
MDSFNIEQLETIPKNLQELVDSNLKEINTLLDIKSKDYNNFVLPYQLLNEKLDVFITPSFHLDSVCNSELTQEVYSKCLPILSEYGTWLGQNEELFSAFKEIDTSKLTDAQIKVCENEIRDFSLSGCGLDDTKKYRLKELSLSLSELSKEFSQNLLDATNDFEMIIDNKDDIKEIPESDLSSAIFTDDNGIEKWKFTLQMPSYLSYITYGTSREKREEIYKAYTSRAPQNANIIDNILKQKNEKSKLLGFDNYSQYSLSTKMASCESDVITFLNDLSKKAKIKADDELNEVKELALELDGIIDLNSFDLAYYSEKLKKAKYDIDEEVYRPYFESNKVLDGLFEFLYKLLNIKFVKIDVKTWHEKAIAYDIYENNIKKSRIYIDLEARKEKRGGAWMNNWHTRYLNNGEVNLPTAYIVCNFPASTSTQPSLLRHSDVVTLFHEMGHALHHLLSNIDEPFVSGINGVAWDVVEFPSQFLEYFSYDKDVLKMFAKHYQTDEIISDDMCDKLIRARNFQSSLATLRQVEFALFDFKLHQKIYQGEEVQSLLDAIRDDIAVMIPPGYNKFQNGFAHIFGGGYAAGYYSYKWAEVLSADAFYLFIENGTFNEELSLKYKDLILGKGGSVDMNDLYFQLANRKPDVTSLLKMDGII